MNVAGHSARVSRLRIILILHMRYFLFVLAKIHSGSIGSAIIFARLLSCRIHLPNKIVMSLDNLDLSILRELQLDGRIKNADLANRVGLSQSACLRRVRALEQSGVIENYVALIHQGAAGLKQDVFVQITLEGQDSQELEAFEAAVRQHPQLLECYLMTGDADYLIRAIVSDSADYERLHREFLTRLPGVDRVVSSFALRTVMKRTEIPLNNCVSSSQDR